MTNVIIYPIKINHETEKAILIHDLLWLPKSQVTVSHHCVVGVASWLYQKNKRYFQYFPEQTIEAVKEYIEYEKEVRQKMQDDPTLCRCSRCGQVFQDKNTNRELSQRVGDFLSSLDFESDRNPIQNLTNNNRYIKSCLLNCLIGI